jgi:hypothetical protein
MSEEFGSLTAESAVTLNEDTQFTKYRAIERAPLSELDSFSVRWSTSEPVGGEISIFDDRSKTAPSRLPITKSELFTEASDSSNFSIKCPEKPCFLSNTSFHTYESSYDKVKQLVEKALDTLDDYDWSYFESECMVSAVVPLFEEFRVNVSSFFFFLFAFSYPLISGNANIFKDHH